MRGRFLLWAPHQGNTKVLQDEKLLERQEGDVRNRETSAVFIFKLLCKQIQTPPPPPRRIRSWCISTEMFVRTERWNHSGHMIKDLNRSERFKQKREVMRAENRAKAEDVWGNIHDCSCNKRIQAQASFAPLVHIYFTRSGRLGALGPLGRIPHKATGGGGAGGLLHPSSDMEEELLTLSISDKWTDP